MTAEIYPAFDRQIEIVHMIFTHLAQQEHYQAYVLSRHADGRDRCGQIIGRRSISEKPVIVYSRGLLGAPEGDTILGAKDSHAMPALPV